MEPPLQRMVRRAEVGELGDDFILRVSRYGYSMTAICGNRRELRLMFREIMKVIGEGVFEAMRDAEVT